MQPVIVPPQSAAPLDGPLFRRDWYLFFQAVQAAAVSGGGIVQFGAAATREALDTVGLANGTLWLETDTGLIYQWRANAPTIAWVFAAGTQVIDETLTAASTTIAAPTAGAVELVVILRQDATGGRAVVWGSGFSAASVALDTTASTISTFRFVLSGGKYVMVGQPTTGMTA